MCLHFPMSPAHPSPTSDTGGIHYNGVERVYNIQHAANVNTGDNYGES